MARVTLTNSLKRHILEQIRAKYEPQRQKLLKEFLEEHREEFYRCVVSEELEEQLKSVPSEFLLSHSALYFSHKGFNYEVDLLRERFLPAAYHSGYHRKRLEFSSELANKAQAMEAKRSQLKTEMESVCKELDEIMGKAETLKQLVEVWPSALELCDAQTVAQYNRGPKPRKTPEKLELSDQSKLALVKVRMT